jgi:hypothetical protein
MEQMSALRIAVVAAAGFAIVALAALLIGARSLGKKPLYAKPSGSGAGGVFYAFFKGMLPWEKESVAKHLPTFVAGLLYHAGIFSALLYLLFAVTRITPTASLIEILRIAIGIGLACGLGLLIKRFSLPKMRLISTVDDAVANLLVDFFLAAALAATLSLSYEPAFFVTAIVLLIYVPIGKIRHCVFFFFTRIVFGLYFGRRGVLPPSYGERGVK